MCVERREAVEGDGGEGTSDGPFYTTLTPRAERGRRADNGRSKSMTWSAQWGGGAALRFPCVPVWPRKHCAVPEGRVHQCKLRGEAMTKVEPPD